MKPIAIKGLLRLLLLICIFIAVFLVLRRAFASLDQLWVGVIAETVSLIAYELMLIFVIGRRLANN